MGSKRAGLRADSSLGGECVNDARDGHQLLLCVDTDQLYNAFDHRLITSLSINLLIKDGAVRALHLYLRSDLESIAKLRTFFERQFAFVDNKPNAVVFPELNELLWPQEMFSGSLKVFEVVGVVDHAGEIGVLIVNLDSMLMGLHEVLLGGSGLTLEEVAIELLRQRRKPLAFGVAWERRQGFGFQELA